MKKHFFRSLESSKPKLPHVSNYQFNDRISNITFIFAFLFISLNAGLVWFNYQFLPPQIPLFLQRNCGVEQLGNRDMIWLQPGVLVICFLVNYAASLMTMRNEPLTARILGGTILICSVMSLISVWHIMNLVIPVRLWF